MVVVAALSLYIPTNFERILEYFTSILVLASVSGILYLFAWLFYRREYLVRLHQTDEMLDEINARYFTKDEIKWTLGDHGAWLQLDMFFNNTDSSLI